MNRPEVMIVGMTKLDTLGDPRVIYKTKTFKKGFKHPDFPAGHPRQYYPGLLVLNFSNRAG